MDVGLRHLELVLAAVRYGSLRRAADALHLKPSTVSRALCSLEQRLGILLFTRTSAGLRATPAGREFVVGAERLLVEFEGLMANAATFARGVEGHITLGLSTQHAVVRLCPLLSEHAQQCPRVHVRLISKAKSALLADLFADALDVAIISGRVISDGIESISLWSDQIFLAVPQAHALEIGGYATWAGMADEVILGSSQGIGPELKEILVAKLGSVGRQAMLEEHAIDGQALLSLVAAGRGVSLQCANVIHIPPPGLRMLELHDEGGPASITYSACWKRKGNNPSLASFLSLLRAHRSIAFHRGTPDR
ncbi:MAG: LysR family transcriptional regulator [Reyranella sp.]|nr:MAG: LysR family transcriptional regulator [Reyranella sp.]